MTLASTNPAMDTRKADAVARFTWKRNVALAVPALLVVYFSYIFFAFDIPGLAQRAKWDNAVILASDIWSHKVHVSVSHRSGEMDYAIEGERKGRYPDGTRPDWVTGAEVPADGPVVLTLDGGKEIRLLPGNVTEIDLPDWGTVEIALDGRTITSNIPDPAPDWASVSSSRISITTEHGRVAFTRAKTEVFRYFTGWELFFYTLDSPYHGAGIGQILFGPQLDATRSNIAGAWEDFWYNPMWRHGDVLWAIGETILMAFLGTFGAAMIALPLAFVAAKGFTPFAILRGAMRRIFDFVRGVDALIWTVVLARAFGPGPLTGALAILITDAGTFGKTFSEALENVDRKQIEGVQSTGANPLQRARFGVIPQVVPILLAQVLYFLESNTRSATIIGAITGGGIGLLLTQAMQTQKDWEEVAYYIVLVVLMVFFMDWLSGWLRGKLIGRKE